VTFNRGGGKGEQENRGKKKLMLAAISTILEKMGGCKKSRTRAVSPLKGSGRIGGGKTAIFLGYLRFWRRLFICFGRQWVASGNEKKILYQGVAMGNHTSMYTGKSRVGVGDSEI